MILFNIILQDIDIKTLQDIKDLSLALSPFLTSIITWMVSHRAFNRLSAKDKKDLDIKLIEQSYKDAEKLITLLEEMDKTLDLEIKKKQFKKFLFYLEHICILILSKTVNDEIFKYKYAIPIRNLHRSNFIKEMHEILFENEPFNPEGYQWLEDTYKFAKRKKFINA